MLEALMDKPTPWMAGNGPESLLALNSRISLSRNLADFPFVARCSDHEKRAVSQRIVSALDSVDLLSRGRYCSLQLGNSREVRVLAERQLIAYDLVHRGTFRDEAHFLVSPPQGAYLSEDGALSIMVNGSDHICIQSVAAGLQLQDMWSRLTKTDDLLAGAVDLAYDQEFGYLTTSLGRVGTGLKAVVVMVLPALTMAGKVPGLEQRLREQRYTLQGLKGVTHLAQAGGLAGQRESLCMGLSEGHTHEAQGDLYELSNQVTLGMPEEEILFNVCQAAKEVFEAERNALAELTSQDGFAIQDRVGRAVGIARGAHLMSFEEALWILASMRLGIEAGLVKGYSVGALNELLVASQSAHIESKLGLDCDDLSVSVERANLFRAAMSQT